MGQGYWTGDGLDKITWGGRLHAETLNSTSLNSTSIQTDTVYINTGSGTSTLGTNEFKFNTGSTAPYKMYIKSAGVGIDNNSPSAPLDVTGTVKATKFEGFGICPIGSILPWHKSFPNTPSLPSGWVECNGQTISDAGSVYNGQVIPDLNGNLSFIRGQSTSGGTGGSDTHAHTVWSVVDGANAGVSGIWGFYTSTPITDEADSKPPFFEVVFIIRIK